MKKLLSFMGSFNMFAATTIATSYVISCGVEITIPPQPRSLQDCLDYKASIESLRYELSSKRKLVERDINEQLSNGKITDDEANELLKNNSSVQDSIKIQHNIYAMNIQEKYYRDSDSWKTQYTLYIETISKIDDRYSSDSTKSHIEQLIVWLNTGLPINEINI